MNRYGVDFYSINFGNQPPESLDNPLANNFIDIHFSQEEANEQIRTILAEILTSTPMTSTAKMGSPVCMLAPSTLSAGRQQYVHDSDNQNEQNYVQTRFSMASILDPDIPINIPSDLALVLCGESLDHLFHDSVKSLFLRLASVCSSVIICRVTPCQKASWRLVLYS